MLSSVILTGWLILNFCSQDTTETLLFLRQRQTLDTLTLFYQLGYRGKSEICKKIAKKEMHLNMFKKYIVCLVFVLNFYPFTVIVRIRYFKANGQGPYSFTLLAPTVISQRGESRQNLDVRIQRPKGSICTVLCIRKWR